MPNEIQMQQCQDMEFVFSHYCDTFDIALTSFKLRALTFDMNTFNRDWKRMNRKYQSEFGSLFPPPSPVSIC